MAQAGNRHPASGSARAARFTAVSAGPVGAARFTAVSAGPVGAARFTAGSAGPVGAARPEAVTAAARPPTPCSGARYPLGARYPPPCTHSACRDESPQW